MISKEVKVLYVGDIIVTSVSGKYRPLVITKVTSDFVYGAPLSTKEEEFSFRSKGIDTCRFLEEGKISYVTATVHRVSGDWAKKHWIGCINPTAVKKIKKDLQKILITEGIL